MPWYKRLRWRLIGSQFLVALVGVAIMLLATRITITQAAPLVIRPILISLIESPTLLAQTEAALLIAFRNVVLLSVFVAAVGAISAGVVSSYILWRTLIHPLRQVANSSQRIANGRYSERVIIPQNSGEAMAQLAINFNEMTIALEQVEQKRIALLGNISHELRTPLTGIKGYVEGLIDGLLPGNTETFNWMLREVNRLSRLVEDIQNLSRVEAGQVRLDLQTFNLLDVVNRIAAHLQPQLHKKHLSLAIDTQQTTILVYADADRTTQVFLNLLSNAMQYTPENGRITIRLSPHQHMAHIEVQDTGIGIPPAALPYLFERFYRVDPSRSRKSGGSGIGLTIVRHLILAMGGTISASSPGEGQGATFTFTLPLSTHT